MMRQFFIGVNNLRDQARAALTGEERELVFGDGTARVCAATGGAASAAAAAGVRELSATAVLDGARAQAAEE